jgi:PHD/YefM family antitoxin component YafN of YafNO toxin-antitoxin module
MTETVRGEKWITIPVDEYESMKHTIDVLSDKEVMIQIREGKKKDVKTLDFEELASELDI